MSEAMVTVTLPGEVYDQLQRRAAARNRSIHEEIVEAILAAVPIEGTLPPEVTETLAPLRYFNDQELWNAARCPFPAEDSAALESLNHKRGREGLTADEEQLAANLLRRYERNLLVRAEAAVLLKQRGHDVSALARQP